MRCMEERVLDTSTFVAQGFEHSLGNLKWGLLNCQMFFNKNLDYAPKLTNAWGLGWALL